MAVRYLSDELLADAEFRARFRGEAALLAELADPHVVRLLEYVESDQDVAIVTERLNAAPLRALLVEEGVTGPEAALVVLKDSLQALAAAATRGVPHGDYKPENVLVTRAGGIRLANFGIASRVTRERLGSSTPFYLAPELWESSATDGRGDLYAATATFFECMVGGPPYYATDPTALRRLHETAPAPVEATPGPVRDLVIHGMAKDPDERPATAEDFLEKLETVAAAGYGPAWERRGRGELAQLAFPPSQPFPPGAAGAALAHKARGRTLLDRASMATAAALILAIGLTGPMLSGDAPEGLGGPFAFGGIGASPRAPGIPPPPVARLLGVPEVFPAPDEPAGVHRFPAAPAPTEAYRRLPGAAPGPPGIVIPPLEHSGATPMLAPLAPETQVTTLSIMSFEHSGPGTRLVVRVDTTGTGPVQLILGYAGGTQGSPATTSVQTVSVQLAGKTSYSITDDHDFADTCTDYWHVVVSTTPAAVDSPQSAEIPAVPCATPEMAPTTTKSAPPPGTG